MLSFIKKIFPASIKNYIKEEIRQIVLSEISKNQTEITIEKEEIHQLVLSEINKNQTEMIIDDVLNSRLLSPLSISPWYLPVVYEPSVNLALQDLCKPGSVVFDVGCHDGQLTLLISRLVGPRGIVCSFEANPHILDLCTHNLIRNGCNNFFMTHGAVWKTSNEVLNLYIPPSNWQAASLSYQKINNSPTPVLTVALDDFISSKKLEPEIIKMDIEGSEFEALQGTYKYINTKKPHLILEQSTEDIRCIDFLKAQGYVAIDLNNYNFINSLHDYPPGSIIRNLLFVHKEKISLTPYSLDMKPKFITSWSDNDFLKEDQIFILNNITLSQGRYLLFTDFESQESEEDYISLCVYVNNNLKVNYIGTAKWIESSYRDSLLHIDQPSEIKIEIMLWQPKDLAKKLNIRINNVNIYQFW